MSRRLPDLTRRVWQVVREDLRRLYSGRNLLRLALGLALGAILANTPLDSWLERAYREHVHADTQAGRMWQLMTKQLGDRYVVVIAPLAGMAAGMLAPAAPLAAGAGAWGQQFTRAFISATPVTYGATWLLGGDRPKNGHGSGWHPLHWVEKGISGHSMAGAIPFLVLAGMTSHPAARVACYACSGLAAGSRIDSRSHYPSQVYLGWWMAFLAVRVVRRPTGLDLPLSGGSLPGRRTKQPVGLRARADHHAW